MIIGLNGYATTGKDTLADLMEPLGYTHLKYAAILKQMAEILNPWVFVEPDTFPDQFLGGHYSYNAVLARVGAVKAKQVDDIREFQQKLGTDAGRVLLGENVWVDALWRRYPDPGEGNFVVSDVRFVNEAEAIVERGGIIVRIDRPGVGPANDHISETGLDDWPFNLRIVNDRTPVAMTSELFDYLSTRSFA